MKIDGGVPIPSYKIKGLSMKIFLLKRGSLGDRSKRGVIGCENAQNADNFNFFFFEIFTVIYKIFQNLMILPENFNQKAKIGGHWV